jgi:hypothetical protein
MPVSTVLNCRLSHTAPRLTIRKRLSFISFWNNSVQTFSEKGHNCHCGMDCEISGIPNILNYCAIFFAVCTYTSIQNLNIRPRVGDTCYKSLSFRLLITILRITDKLQNISSSTAEPWTWKQNLFRTLLLPTTPQHDATTQTTIVRNHYVENTMVDSCNAAQDHSSIDKAKVQKDANCDGDRQNL